MNKKDFDGKSSESFSIKETQEEFEESRKYYQEGNILNFDYNKKDDAIIKYREAMRKTNDHGVYYHLSQGQIYIIIGKLDDALTEFEIASEINDKIEDVYINLGLTYRKLAGRYSSFGLFERAEHMIQESLSSYKRALDINPRSTVVYSTLSITFLNMDDFIGAESCAKKALELDPNNYLAHTALSQIKRFQGKNDEARKLALKSIEINPHQAFAYSMLGARKNKNILPLEPKPSKAIEWLKLAFEREPQNTFVLFEFAKTYREINQFDEALTWYNKLAELDFTERNYGLYANRGYTYLSLGELDLAEKDLKKSLTIRPDFVFGLSTLMNLRKEQGRNEEALELAKKLNELKDTFENRKNIKEFEQLVSKDRDDSIAITRWIIKNRSKIDVTEKQIFNQIEKALTLYSKNYDAWGLLGRYYTAKKQYHQSKKYLEKSLSLRGKDSYYRLDLAQVLEALKEWKASEREYKIVLAQSPALFNEAKKGLKKVQEHLRKRIKKDIPEIFKGDKIVFLNNKTGRVEHHYIKLIRNFLYDRMNDWKLPIREIIENIGKDPVFIIAKTGVGKTVTVPTKVLLELCDKLIKEGADLSKKFPQVYVVEPRIPICTMTMAEMNEGYQNYLAYQMTHFSEFKSFLIKKGLKNLNSKDRNTINRIIELSEEFVKTGKAPYNPKHLNLYGCITSVTGKVNADAPILFITTGIMESMTFDSGKLDPKYHRIIIDEAHVTIEANPSIELGIGLARKKGINIDYMSATVNPASLEKDLGVKIVYAGTQRFPIYLSNLNANVEDCILDIVENYLLNPSPDRFPDPNKFSDPKIKKDIERIRLHLLSNENYKDDGKEFPGLSNRPQGLLVIVNSHQSENSDTRRISDIVSQADFNRNQKNVHVLRLASPVVRDPSQKITFDRMIEKIESENGRYVIVATNVVEMGLTFSSLDYVITMDSEFYNEFVDGGQMITKVALGVNALYQRIGRAGRIRPGMAFIAEDFGAPYCKYDDQKLSLGLPVEPIRYPIRKGSFQKLALYSYREQISESQLRNQIALLKLPSRIHEDNELWSRFLAERKRLQDIGIASRESLTTYGTNALTYIGLDDMDFAKLLSTAYEKFGMESDLAIIFTLLASSSELGFDSIVDKNFVLINPRQLSLVETFHQDIFGMDISEIKELIYKNQNDIDKLSNILIKQGVEREVVHDVSNCLLRGYTLEISDKDNITELNSFEERQTENETDELEYTNESGFEFDERLNPLINSLSEQSKQDILTFTYSAISLNDQSELINIWRVYRYFFNKYFSRIRTRTLNNFETSELKKMIEKQADGLQLIGRSLNGLNNRFLDLCRHTKIKLPKEEIPLAPEYKLTEDEYDILIEVCIQELLFERIGNNDYLNLCIKLFELVGLNGDIKKSDFSNYVHQLQECGFETNEIQVKELWFLIVRDAQKRITEEIEVFRYSISQEILPPLTKGLEKELLSFLRSVGYHKKLKFKKGHWGFETTVQDQLGKQIKVSLSTDDNPLAPSFDGLEQVTVFAKLNPAMFTLDDEDNDDSEPKEEKGFRLSHVTIVD